MRRLLGIVVPVLLIAVSAPARPQERAAAELTLVTYNILHGSDDRGRLNLRDKGEYIAGLTADLVFLQEIDQNCERSDRVDQMAFLGKATGMEPAFGSFMPYQGGQYGLGTLSALPVRSTSVLRLPEGDEPRVALLSEVELVGRPLLAVNVHLNWTEDDTSRFSQATALLAELETIELPTIVAGDFNDEPDSRTMQAFYQAGFRHVERPGPSWNARTPTVDIDHILVRDGSGLQLEPIDGQVLDERALSDHRPVLGRIRMHLSD